MFKSAAGLRDLERHGEVLLVKEDVPEAVRARLLPLDGRRPGVPAALVEASTNRLAVDVDAPKAGLLAVTEAWLPGRTAQVDGEDAPVVRANGMMQAVPVDEGPHRVTLVFRPWYFLGPAWLALAALLGALVLVRREARRGR
ncbi:MAG: YfhO family protein [Myxococcota bacterium]